MSPNVDLAAALEGRTPELVAIGGSAGSLSVLLELVPAFPSGTRASVLVVVHTSEEAGTLLPDLLAPDCPLPVKVAESSEALLPGRVYVAPGGYHMSVEADRSVSLSREAPVRYSRPSIDLLLESAANAVGRGLVGIVLTGANTDGTAGLRRVRQKGGLAVVQDPRTADWPTMPASALQALPGALVLDRPGLRRFARLLGEVSARRASLPEEEHAR